MVCVVLPGCKMAGDYGLTVGFGYGDLRLSVGVNPRLPQTPTKVEPLLFPIAPLNTK